jgi:hypothetical protein
MSPAIDFSADADATPEAAAPDTLARTSDLASQLVSAIDAVGAADVELKKAKELQRRLEEEDLPELMREVGLTEMKLSDGSAVTVKDEVSCAITEEKRTRAHAWLVEHGFGGLIKTEVVVAFGREEHDEALACAEKIHDELSREAVLEERVHPATLKSFIKEQREAGLTPPTDLFGIFTYAKAKVVAPSKPKSKKK